jgi:TonB family protein
MGFKSISTLVVAALVCGSGTGYARPVQHKPVNRWIVDFADNQCVASLNFGDSKNPLFFGLKPSPLGEIMQVVVVKKAGYFESPDQLPVKIQVDNQPPLEFSMLAVGGKPGAPDNFRINLALADFAPLRTATSVTIISGGKLNETFQLVQMPALLKAMDACVADLRRHWNIDPDLKAKLRARAKGDLISLFSSNDYPGVSLQKRQGGLVGMVILIDEMGKPADCMVTQTSGSAALDTQACAIVVKRARFEPAIGEDGKPAKDSYISRIRWETP